MLPLRDDADAAEDDADDDDAAAAAAIVFSNPSWDSKFSNSESSTGTKVTPASGDLPFLEVSISTTWST